MESANDMRRKISDKAGTDDDFRARLLDDPKGAIGDELGVTLPAGFKVEVHEEAANVAHLVLPPSSRLSEADMRQAAGGTEDAYDPSKPQDRHRASTGPDW